MFRVTSHMSQEPWPWKCESAKESAKGCFKTPPKSCSVVTNPQVLCEAICDWALNQMLFQWIFIHASRHTWQNIINQWLWAFGIPWSLGFVLGLPPRGGFWQQFKGPWNMIHLMPCRNPCRLYTHLAFAYSISPLSVVWSELGPAPPLLPTRVLEVQWSWALNLVCEVGL